MLYFSLSWCILDFTLATMASKNKKRDLFMGDEYWNESSKKVTPFDFDDDTDTDTFMTMVSLI